MLLPTGRMAACCAALMLAGVVAGCSGSEEPDGGQPAAGNGRQVGGVGPKAAVESEQTGENMLTLHSEPFGEHEGQPVTQYLLSNGRGLSVWLIDYGAIVTAVNAPDRSGHSANVTLSFDDLDGYVGKDPFFGAIVGRYANRIAGGRFTLDGIEYELAKNNGPNHLHGGNKSFADVLWQSRPLHNDVTEGAAVGVEFTHVSPDGDENYPGRLALKVTYLLNDKNELRIDYEATTDKPTPVNFTNHCYWNLAGLPPVGQRDDTPSVLDHVVLLSCDRYLPVDETLIPTGELASVQGTPFDFTSQKAIAREIGDLKADNPNGGYDHCFVIDGEPGTLRLAARVRHPASGRVLEVETTEPGVQLYTGNFLDGSESAGGFGRHRGVCLECQHFPDSPNQPEFPNTILRPQEVYRQTTVHRFLVEE